jgi:chemotaxis protein CheX
MWRNELITSGVNTPALLPQKGNAAMDASSINAFVKAVENVFSMMLQTSVTVHEPVLKATHEPKYDVSGIIGISGDMFGVIVLSFPVEVAERVASMFTGMTLKVDDEDFTDAVGELVNMVSGNAKASFEDKRCQISCPTVVVGKGHTVFRQRNIPSIELPCSCDCGDFIVEISVRDNVDKSRQIDAAAATSA